MDLFQAAVLGAVQGVSEFLPISSTAHLILVPALLGWKDPGLTFDVALHLGTFAAVAVYFWRDFIGMGRAGLLSVMKGRAAWNDEARLAWMVVLGCVPAAAAGLMLEEAVETTFRSPLVISTMLIGVAFLLGLAEVVGTRVRELTHLRLPQAIAIGIAQACALIPGTSRSGATMTAAMFMGFSRESAARFSFLLGFPIILASCLFKAKDTVEDVAIRLQGAQPAGIMSHILASPQLPAFAVGIVTSGVVGYLCIRFLMQFLQQRSMWGFIGYRIALGLLIAGLAWTHHLPGEMIAK